MSFYGDLAITADELLGEFGQGITLRRQNVGGYDPEAGGETVTTTDESGQGAVFDFGLHQSGASFAAGSMIVAGDKQLYLSPVGISAPRAGDLAIIGGEAWSIVSVKSTAPAGVPVLYEAQLRK